MIQTLIAIIKKKFCKSKKKGLKEYDPIIDDLLMDMFEHNILSISDRQRHKFVLALNEYLIYKKPDYIRDYVKTFPEYFDSIKDWDTITLFGKTFVYDSTKQS